MSPTGRSRIVQIHPTRRCNLRCLHCYSSSGPEERGELAAALLSDALTDAAAQGYTVASFSGGEPTLYRPLPELLAHAHRLGLLTTVTSNGMLLDSRRLARLSGVIDLLAISLDGVPESHDRMRADPTAFATMASRLDGVRRSGIPFGFIFTLTQHNLDELFWVADFALAEGARLLQIHPLEQAGRALERLPEARPDHVEASYAFLVARDLQERFGDRLQVQLDLAPHRKMEGEPCRFFAGKAPAAPEIPFSHLLSPLIVEADGTVVPVEYGFARRFALGNLHQARLAELAPRWRQERYPEFQSLCRDAFAAFAADPETPLLNWYEAVRQASNAVPAPA
ncbi:MAG: radical SAM protein [Acidobacteriota bacterium]|nr:radical SAM protein [Acidobacteriota bacterium]